MKRRIVLASTMAILTFVASATAHHSFAAFDGEKNLALTGTVKEFQWTNPHSWIQLMVTDSGGKQTEWSIEAGSPNSLARTGWKRTSIKAGDKAEIVVHPMKDGSPGGSLVNVKVNGTVLGQSPGK